MTERPTMRRLVDRWSPSVLLFIAAIKSLQYLRKLGLHPREDGFRRSTRAFFRSQEAHPCMPAFGLGVAGRPTTAGSKGVGVVGAGLVADLQGFLAGRPEMGRSLRWGRFQAKMECRTTLDLAEVDVASDGSLIGVRPFWDPRPTAKGILPDDSGVACEAMVEAFNRTRSQPDKRRPLDLQRELLRQVGARLEARRASRSYVLDAASRLADAIWVYVETLPAACTGADRPDARARLQPPRFRERLGPGPGGFVVTARMHPNGRAADLWFHYNHSLCDGAPFAEMLLDLEREWGIVAPLVLPPPDPPENRRPWVLCSGPGSKESWVLEDRLDFAPLLARRRQLETRLTERLKGEKISTVGLLAWSLAQQEAYRDIKFTVVVDMPAVADRERTLGIAPIRPSTFFDDGDPDGAFLAFNRELGRRIQAARERTSEWYEMVESIALLPASLYPLALRLFGAGIRECVGTLGISVIRDSAVVIAAQGDIHVDGFLGLGRFDLADEGQGQAGVVAVKGPPDKIDGYLLALRAAVG